MRSIQNSLLVTMLSILGAIQHPPTATAQGWTWPENPENLKVLPDTISPEVLRQTMRGFTSALGVRCEHCHVGQAGMPLSEFDFPADEKREKQVAREMIRMVERINDDFLAGIEEPSGTKVTCFTCHREQPTPPEPLDRLLVGTFTDEGPEVAMSQNRELRDAFYGSGVYNFSARTFTRVADELLGQDRSDDAIMILQLGLDEHPEDGLVRFYVGQAYLAGGDTLLARMHLEEALLLSPESGFIRRALQSLDIDER